VHVTSATSAVSLHWYTPIYANTYSQWQSVGSGNWVHTNLSAVGNTSMYLSATTTGNTAITSDAVTVATSLHGTEPAKRYFELEVYPSQIWINAGWNLSSIAGTSSGGAAANNSPTSGKYSANWIGTTGTKIITALIDPNVSKCYFWQNGTYLPSETAVMTPGSYYAVVIDGDSSNNTTAAYASIFKGTNSAGTATNFTYDPVTLYNTNISPHLATISDHGTSWGASGAVADSGYSTTYDSSTLTYTGSGTGSNFQAYAPEHNFLNASNWTDSPGDRVFIKLYFSGLSGNLSNRKAGGFCFDYTETGNNLDDPGQSVVDNYVAIRGDNNSVANSSTDESGSQGWTTYYRPGTFDAFYAGLYFNKRTGYSAFYWSSTENGTYTKWADKTFSTIPTGIYAWVWRRTAGQNSSVKLVDATSFTDII